MIAIALSISIFSSCKKVVSVDSVELDNNMVALAPGEEMTLTATVNPNDATNKNLRWESSNPAVARVIDGLVTAVSEGEVDITVLSDNDRRTVCKLTVTSNQMTMVSQDGRVVVIGLAGAEAESPVTIDWGDGTRDFGTISSDINHFVHTYSRAETRTITITGNSVTKLNCPDSHLTSLDVSKNPLLTELHCYNNRLASLDLSKNTALTLLLCNINELTDLDLRANTELTFLSCRDNQLTSLYVSGLSRLLTLWCFRNRLTNLNLSGLTLLLDLNCSYNRLTELDLSDSQWFLSNVNCTYNRLSSDAINNLFNSLHDTQIEGGKTIDINDNYGSMSELIDRSIAESKGWAVIAD